MPDTTSDKTSDPVADLLTNGLSGDANSMVTMGLSSTVVTGSSVPAPVPVAPGDVNTALAAMLEVQPDGTVTFKASAFRNLAPALFGTNDVRFEFTLASASQQMAAATQNVRVRVLAFRGSVPLYAPLYSAFIAVSSTPPTADQWTAAVWDEEGCATALYGPDGGATVPAAGTVPSVWVKISNAPETTIERVASVAFL